MRRLLYAVPVSVLALALGACTDDDQPPGSRGTPTPTVTATATGAAQTVRLLGSGGQERGTVTFRTVGDHVVVEVAATGLEEGFHGLHVHEVGRCEGDFTSAGGHFVGDGAARHGEHDGDLPPLLVTGDDGGTLTVRTDRFTLDDLDDDNGAAVVVHAGPDNLAHVPERYDGGPDEQTLRAGDSGDRVACGVIFPDEATGTPGTTTSPTTGGTATPTTVSPSPLTTRTPTGTPSPTSS